MKIVDETPELGITFGQLVAGQCFKVPHGTYYYLKMSAICNDEEEVTYNAVFLEDGEPTYFDDDQEVAPLDAKVVIN